MPASKTSTSSSVCRSRPLSSSARAACEARDQPGRLLGVDDASAADLGQPSPSGFGRCQVLGHLGSRETRSHAERAESVFLELGGERLGQAVHGGFRAAVSALVRGRPHACVARQVDDAAFASREHARHDLAAEVVGAGEARRHVGPPVVRIDLPERPDGTQRAGVVHEDGDRACIALDLLHRTCHRVQVRHVGDRGDRLRARLLDEQPGLLERRG